MPKGISLMPVLKETVLEPVLKLRVQTSCRKRSKEFRSKTCKVTERREAMQAVSQNLQLVLAVHFYQQHQFLLAVPEKRIQQIQKSINISALYRLLSILIQFSLPK